MCDTTFALGQRGGHFFQCPSKRNYTRLPKKLAQILSSSHVQEIYHVTLGFSNSFLITYRDTSGEDHIACNDLPQELTTFLHATSPSGTPLRVIPSIRLTLGPHNTSWFVTDGSSYLWKGLPSLLNNALKSRIKDRAWIDRPRIVALGVHKDFLLVTEGNEAVWDLPHYRNLGSLLESSHGNEHGIEAFESVVLHPYRYRGFISLSQNGTLQAENLPSWSLEAVEGMRGPLRKDIVGKREMRDDGWRRENPRRTLDANELRRKQDEVRRKTRKIAEFNRKWNDRAGELEMKASARGLKLNLNFTISPAGIRFGL